MEWASSIRVWTQSIESRLGVWSLDLEYRFWTWESILGILEFGLEILESKLESRLENLGFESCVRTLSLESRLGGVRFVGQLGLDL